MGGVGIKELFIILVIALVVFGTKKLRSIGSDLGGAIHEYKKSMDAGDKAQSAPPKQITDQDAEFSAADKTGTKPEQKTGV